MGSSQLIVFGFVLVCVRLSDARFLSMSEPIYWGVEAQKPAAAVKPERGHSGAFVQEAGRLQVEQLQPTVNALSWSFPADPVDPVIRPPPKFEWPQRVTSKRVAVRCGESRVQVEVSQDLLGLGKLIKPEDTMLGGCSATDVDKLSHVLVFESELHGCDSKLVMTDNAFIYAFTLVYNPKVLSGIIRSQRVVIGVECHYPR
ncbi:putative zona pellucida sperm-binding protein 3-like isoform 2 [Scophthalmus maximus]|uniref:Putative zona pellucida sperm-binding protein 3-like isoform 2 n=1 Tax=Scophthalmus maximus TaxID=52904 RepID=A0A2U9B390_SCOMX|nr:zona pellucida sperm-binding protein 3-like [Scophthalmus maximus]AWO98413.1 putative zona pellucida sperm-binding protein 3-like isoform 2 [Scophthalmus maximus]